MRVINVTSHWRCPCGAVADFVVADVLCGCCNDLAELAITCRSCRQELVTIRLDANERVERTANPTPAQLQ